MQFLASPDMQVLDRRQMRFRKRLYLSTQEYTRRISGGDASEYVATIDTQYAEKAKKATRRL